MDPQIAREQMVRGLIDSSYLTDPIIIDAMRTVERHKFISSKDQAYQDHPVGIGCDQTISAPHMVAIMTEAICIFGARNILEIGTGSGYQAAILSECCPDGRITTVERIEELGEKAKKKLKTLGYDNIECIISDGTSGWADNAPYDRIMVTAAGPRVPKPLLDQLAPLGRLIMPIGPRNMQRLIEVKKDSKGEDSMQEICGCIFVPLIGEHGYD